MCSNSIIEAGISKGGKSLESRSSISAGVNLAQLRTQNFFDSYFSRAENSAKWGPIVGYKPNIELYRQDAAPRKVYFIERGLVKLSCTTADGRQLIVALRRRHWLLGSAAVLLDRSNAATATTLTSCVLRSVSPEKFRNLMNADHIFLMQVCMMLSKEVYRNTHDSVMMGCMPARARLEEFLCELVLEQEADLHKRIMLELPLRHFELAQIIGVRHEYLSTLLRKLEQEGVLLRERSRLVITDPYSLIVRSSFSDENESTESL
jgi:CRP/FNR family cyclic AMP-dependent transcriptional regulator